MKPQCQHCNKFFATKHGRNIHEFWCPSNPANEKYGAPPENKLTKIPLFRGPDLAIAEAAIEAYKKELPKLIELAKVDENNQTTLDIVNSINSKLNFKLEASKPSLNYCPNCAFNVQPINKPNYCPNCGVHLDGMDLY